MNLVYDTILFSFWEQHDFEFGWMLRLTNNISFSILLFFLGQPQKNKTVLRILFTRTYFSSFKIKTVYFLIFVRITAMKRDHFMVSLLLNMIVVWYFSVHSMYSYLDCGYLTKQKMNQFLSTQLNPKHNLHTLTHSFRSFGYSSYRKKKTNSVDYPPHRFQNCYSQISQNFWISNTSGWDK